MNSPLQRPKVAILKLNNYDESFGLPSYETKGASGADIKACLKGKQDVVIASGERVLIPTGLAVDIPQGFEIQVRPRSGLSFKTSLMVVNSPGTIDSDYRGEIKILLGNFGKIDEIIKHGDRIAQLVLSPIAKASFIVVDALTKTQRDLGGFGHTGRG